MTSINLQMKNGKSDEQKKIKQTKTTTTTTKKRLPQRCFSEITAFSKTEKSRNPR